LRRKRPLPTARGEYRIAAQEERVRVPHTEVNGVRLYYEFQGQGAPVVLLHGSWGDASSWQPVLPRLADSCRVLVYDRRGHSRSGRPHGQGSFDQDGDDLAALLEALDVAPAHVVANSSGANIALRLAPKREELFRSLSCHEPPLWDLLPDEPGIQELRQKAASIEEAVGKRIAEGDHEGAAQLFADEVAFGPGAWENALPAPVKAMFVSNAPTFLDELQDPDQYAADLSGLAQVQTPLLLTQGSESPPLFAQVIDRLVKAAPRTRRQTLEGAGHVPHLTAPDRYAEGIVSFVHEVEASISERA
jgi:pimeloyl-ACP methyl ester carboxylesterase